MNMSVDKRRVDGFSSQIYFRISLIVAYSDEVSVFYGYIAVEKFVCKYVYILGVSKHDISLFISERRVYSVVHGNPSFCFQYTIRLKKIPELIGYGLLKMNEVY